MISYFKTNVEAFGFLSQLKFKRMLLFRVNFISQIIGMCLNNLMYFTVWWLLLQRFGSINGYSLKDFILIQGFSAFFYAIYFWSFGGLNYLGEIINEDKFLDLQLYPISPLTMIVTKGGSASHFGDLFQGLVFLIIYFFINPISITWIIPALILIVAGFFGLSLIYNSLLFFFPRLIDISDLLTKFYIGSSTYPSGNFQGGFRTFLHIAGVFPIIFFPIEVTRGLLHPGFLLWSLLATLLVLVLGLFLWGQGIKRVESGSSFGALD